MQDLKELKKQIEETILQSDQVIITPHKGVDFDAIASSIAFSLISSKLGKMSYIIINEDASEIEAGVKLIMEEFKDYVNFININKYHQIKGDNDLLIATDVNQKDRIWLEEYLDDFKQTIVVDHHNEGKNSIPANVKYVSTNISSVCEIMPLLLCMFGIRYDKMVADYLLTGIYLDTDHLRKDNATSKTMESVAKLMKKGATLSRVNYFFEEDLNSYQRVQELISKGAMMTYTIITAVADPSQYYRKEELAKAANTLSGFRLVDASFVMGFTEEGVISISARSKGNIDVSMIMAQMNGGGSPYHAATRIESENLEEPAKQLKKIIQPQFYIEKNSQK